MSRSRRDRWVVVVTDPHLLGMVVSIHGPYLTVDTAQSFADKVERKAPNLRAPVRLLREGKLREAGLGAVGLVARL